MPEDTIAETTELQLAPPQADEPHMKQLQPFDAMRAEVEKLKATAETLTVTDINDKKSMAIARVTRLGLKAVRVAVDHRHRELKAHILEEGKKLDADKRGMLALIEPLEEKMLALEEFAEREAVRIEDEQRAARVTELTPFLSGPLAVDLGKMTAEDYAAVLADAKLLQKARENAAAKVLRDREVMECRTLALIDFGVKPQDYSLETITEAEFDEVIVDLQRARLARIAKEKEDAEERERIRLENERLHAEAVAREAAALKEREEAAAALKAEQDRNAAALKAERERLEAEAAEERRLAKIKADELEEMARVEREAVAAERKKAAESAEKENARLAGIAEAERQKAATAARIAKEEKDKSDAIIAEIKRKGEEAKAKADAEHAAELARIEAAALAPDKEKLAAFAAAVRALPVPELATPKAEELRKLIDGQVEKFAAWVEKKGAEL